MAEESRILVAAVVMLAASGCIGGDSTPEATTTSTSSSTSTSTSTSSSLVYTTIALPATTTSTLPKLTYTTIVWGSCSDGLQNQGEEGVDCGGPCASCEIDCFVAADCGETHYMKEFCDGNTITKYRVTYSCLSGGEVNSSCRMSKEKVIVRECPITRVCFFTNYCQGGPACEEARCIRPENYCEWTICEEDQ